MGIGKFKKSTIKNKVDSNLEDSSKKEYKGFNKEETFNSEVLNYVGKKNIISSLSENFDFNDVSLCDKFREVSGGYNLKNNLETMTDYMKLNRFIDIFGEEPMNNICNNLIDDKIERSKIFDIEGPVSIENTFISSDLNEGSSYTLKGEVIKNPDTLDLEIGGKKNREKLGSLSILRNVDINSDYKDLISRDLIYKYGLNKMFSVGGINYCIIDNGDNNFELKIDNKNDKDFLKQITRNIKPNFKNLPGDTQKNITFN